MSLLSGWSNAIKTTAMSRHRRTIVTDEMAA
jgi:hypothetical protein